MQGSATELHWEARLGILLVSSSKEATRAVSLGGPKIGAVCRPSPTFGSRSKLTSVDALQLALGRKRCQLSRGGQSLEHLKTGEDRPLKNDQHSGEEGLDWWEVTPTHIKIYHICQIHQIHQIGDPLLSNISHLSNTSDTSNR